MKTFLLFLSGVGIKNLNIADAMLIRLMLMLPFLFLLSYLNHALPVRHQS